MPHIDGMLPVVSTRSLSNFELTLSPDASRVGQHRCSNLLDYSEVDTRYGFLTDATKNLEVFGETKPYEYSTSLRGSSTLRFYRNLNLEACLWNFTSYYDISELLSVCGGTIGTDGQVLNLVQSYLTLRVPLHVSYVFHSPGQLVVNFRTEARFRGLFVSDHPASSLSSMVMCPDHPGLTFNLSLVRSEPTYNQPIQQWTFISDFAVRDYSGMYTVKLIPCTSPPSLEYTIPPVCNPREALSFDLDIRFQQVSDPVAAEFSLNTQMLLLSKRTLWLSDGSMGFGQETDTAFSPGDTVYGRVMVDPVQNLGDSFICNIEKVFLCTGADGYVPKYNPSNFEFGCLADAPSLLYRFKIIDKAQPETQAHSFGDVAFNAFLAVDDPGALPLVRQPGADGFRMDSSALFQVAAGREWYIHSIYTVRSRTNANRGIGKRSLEYHVMSQYSNILPKSQHRSRRSASDVPDIVDEIGEGNNRGTNILHIALDRSSQRKMSPDGEIVTKSNNPHELNKREGDDGLVLIIGVFVGLLFTVLIVIVVVLLVRAKREKKEVPRNSSSAEPMMMTQGLSSTDSSEV
uniref:Fras1 related extracellular matrix protein 2b n=1 Tax=Nothobranchius pienaari TaxID=704102 RepID=A0A1A8MS37_9TELE